jgi:hypothetical protein
MKKLGLCTILATFACCLLASLNPMKAYAGPSTSNLVFTGGTGSGNGYPYSFTVNGSNQSLMCISDFTNIQNGEAWTADVYTPATAPLSGPGEPVAGSGISTLDFEAAAWLFDDAVAHPANLPLDNEATWYLFDRTGPNNIPAAVTAANAALAEAGSIGAPGNVLVYIWDGNTHTISGQVGTEDPQMFLGQAPPIPEPGTLFLLGTGLMGLALLVFRKAGNRSSGLVFRA